MSNLDRYKADIARLSKVGRDLALSLQIELNPQVRNKLALSVEEAKSLPNVTSNYEAWYSEALACIAQVMPERLEDFSSLYRPKGVRKEILYSNYTMSDYLRGTIVTRYGDEIAGPSSALRPLFQQSNIVSGLSARFESTLFEIKTLLQADLFDNELDAARELNQKGFVRGAGAVAGVVLEGHLASVCGRHRLTTKKNASIADLNEALKASGVTDIPAWRFIQHLGDLRNKCDHKKAVEPTKSEIDELVAGVAKITKTIF